jgi:membrane-bound metal-dependent hydrolase YbcI (DUF457 family)
MLDVCLLYAEFVWILIALFSSGSPDTDHSQVRQIADKILRHLIPKMTQYGLTCCLTFSLFTFIVGLLCGAAEQAAQFLNLQFALTGLPTDL